MVERTLSEATFTAMGSDCRLVADLPSEALTAAIHRIEDLESRWSRFRADSEISRCNHNAGMPTPVSAVTELLVRRAIDAQALTAGRFDPLMLRPLEALGYCVHWRDRDACWCDPLALSDSAITNRTIAVDAGYVTIPVGTGFDPGGIGKGLAADLVAEELVDRGATWVLVSLGGDLRVAGSLIAEQGWSVEVEDPLNPGRRIGRVELRGGALATSSTQKRRWTPPGLGAPAETHHLLDAQSQQPSTGARIASTVHADSAWWADVVASVLTTDDHCSTEHTDEWNVRACAVTADGEINDLRLELLQPIGPQS